MWLDELADLVRRLRERIEKHGDRLSKNESATRYTLVDPVLRALGWDLEDPSDVVPEYTAGRGRADYGMMVGRAKPRLIVEAKSLGTPTRHGIDQSIMYCIAQGIQYFAVTDGQVWEVYEPHRAVPIGEKLVTSFDLRGPEHETVLKLLWLWRGNFVVGEPVLPSEGPAPLPPPEKPERENGPPPPPDDKWIPLADLHPQPKQRPRPPQAIRFGGLPSRPITYWYQMQVRVVEWLVETQRLSAVDCPVFSSKGAHLVHTEPVRQSGSKFENPEKAAGLWIDKCHDSEFHTYIAKSILKKRGVDPATVYVLPHSE